MGMKILTVRNVALTVILSIVIALAIPVKQPKAFCETTVQVTASQGISTSAQTGAISGVIEGLKGFIAPVLGVLQLDMIRQIVDFSDSFRNMLGGTWGTMEDYYKDMTAQLHTAEIDQSRIKGSTNDAENFLEVKRAIERSEAEAWDRYQASEESCVFDTLLPAYQTGIAVSKAASSAMSSSISSGFVNVTQTPIERTPVDLAQTVSMFCNPNENGGNTLCTAATPRMDDDIEISQTIFGSDTLEITDPTDAAEDIATYETIVDNLLGRPRSQQIPLSALESNAGKQMVLNKRSDAAQLNLAAGLIIDPIVERLPQGVTIPWWRPMRVASGTPTNEVSDEPSKYELLQGYIEFINTPEYFQRLGGGEATIAQKDLHVKAIKLMLMDSDLAHTEKLMSIFSVQLANHLDQHAGNGDE